MNKYEAVRAVIEATTDEPIVFTTGYASRIGCGIADRPRHFYMTGSMGLASSIGVGVAQHSGLHTVVIDGDGALLMNPVGLLVVGEHRSLPLTHIVLDDGRYASTGGQCVPAGPDLSALAAACGYGAVHDVTDPVGLGELVRSLVTAPVATPTFVRCVLRGPEAPVAGRVEGDLGDHATRFRERVAVGTGGSR